MSDYYIIQLAANTLLALVGLGLVFAGFRQLRLGTRLRNLTRRVLGIEQFEKLTISELRGYRADVDRWTRDMPTRAQVAKIGLRGDGVDVALRQRGSRLNLLKREVEEMGILLRSYTDALGPMWTTAQGHKMPLRLLSTSHLRNIVDGDFARSGAVSDFIENELDRRKVDAGYREDEARGKPAPTLEQMRNTAATEARDRIIPLAADIQERVVRVLPFWAQDLISDLRFRRTNGFATPSMTRRIKGLPIWTRELITDLVRRGQVV